MARRTGWCRIAMLAALALAACAALAQAQKLYRLPLRPPQLWAPK